MKSGKTFNRLDTFVTIACVLFLMANIAAVGPVGRKTARKIICVSNLRLLGHAFDAYTKDYDNGFMNGWVSQVISGENGGWDTWVGVLPPYYKDLKALLCPMAVKTSLEGGRSPYTAWYGDGYDMDPTGTQNGGALKGKRGSYAINWWVTNPYDYTRDSYKSSPDNWKTTNVANASNIPVLAECGAVWRVFPDNGDTNAQYNGDVAFSMGVNMARVQPCRHDLGFTNMLFMDWSARPVGIKQVWTLKWHRTFDTEGIWTLAGGVQPGDWPEWMQDFQDY